jgi:hypothetical protein
MDAHNDKAERRTAFLGNQLTPTEAVQLMTPLLRGERLRDDPQRPASRRSSATTLSGDWDQGNNVGTLDPHHPSAVSPEHNDLYVTLWIFLRGSSQAFKARLAFDYKI